MMDTTELHHFLVLDDDGVVITVGSSNLPQDDAIEVDAATAAAAVEQLRRAKWIDGALAPYEPPPPPEPVPSVASDRQFFQALAVVGLIGEDEALAAVMTGTIPAAMAGFIDTLPPAERFAARMLLCGATQFERANPLVAAFGAAQTPPMDDAALDQLWRTAAVL